ncbi:DNA helicase-2 / ATP-dependent DNA helicase PcrA [Chitinophaga costaii]|uniref:DNA 3'-5' helicase n=1 Tax=Chitinophaga costaii TaxID=1335309 RepID=A0A1C4A7P6_9BACT|nr:ATP-dependent DNA helicase [Chitinophaga costaii]PUZ26864.1 ATP-dependent helicase [Chitinophaga costaii]SCB90678.1 DNA helicase-2 / ATP-dependent DNA helicase PcrA [Chitinophaga costaii]
MAIIFNQYNQRFQEVYERLNERQRNAVDHTEGPVMVIAGPGTGKTQILASRIGKILRDTDFLPQNILCLTYTDAGTVAMRRRLTDFIGPDAYRVHIHTFHSFCNEVIQDNLGLFDKTILDPISDLEKIQLLKKLIDGFKKDNPLKRYRGDVYFDMNNLANLFSTMKREGWTSTFIREAVNVYINDLPTRDEYICKRATKDFKKGDVRTDKILVEKEKMARLLAAVTQFDVFQQLMLTANRYDFDDMINWVIRAFSENPGLLADYKERFQYILVDEYQDTSGTQNHLIQLLVKDEIKPNIFVVGDDDQSIYRFQGANVENMAQFADSFSDSLRTIVLTQNYRSVQEILNVSMTLIEHNGHSRLVNQLDGLSKDLVAANEQLIPLHLQPVIHRYNTPKDEMAGITMQVQQLLQQGTPPGKIAVIYRENRYGEELAQYFRLLNLPFYSKRSINLLEHPFAKKVLTLLRYVAAELDTPYSGDDLLFEIMHYDFYNIAPVEAAKATIRATEKSYQEKTSLRQYLKEWAATRNLSLFSDTPEEAIVQLSRTTEKWIKEAHNVTLQQLFADIIHEGGVLSYIMQSPEKIWLMKVLQALFDFLKEETRRNPDLTIVTFMEMVSLMKSNGLPIPLVQVSGNEKGINLITAHGSKGLEFEYVFMAGTNSHVWEKKRKNNSGFAFPDTVFTTQSLSSDEQELRRLFYVAVTRTEKHLYISYPEFRADGKPLEPSMFISEIQEQHVLPNERIEHTPEAMFEFELLHYHQPQAPEIQRVDHLFIDHLLSNFVMNVTALNNYLDCPLGFFYKNLVRVPTGRSENTEFGSAVHYAIEKLFVKMQENGRNEFPAKEEFLRDFGWSMTRNRECFTREAFARRMEYGKDILSEYYDTYVHTWNKIVSVERNVRNVEIKGIPIKGKVDKMEFDGQQVNVVDYKTGDYEKAIKEWKKFERPNDRNPNGGDYWRQAVFYKILLDNYKVKNWKVVSTEFDFIEPNKQKVYHKEKVVITPDDQEVVTSQIVDVWNKIQNKEFYIGCGKEDCHWCNFIKDNKMHVALHDLLEEEDAG